MQRRLSDAIVARPSDEPADAGEPLRPNWKA
jgi:hypothetical protein